MRVFRVLFIALAAVVALIVATYLVVNVVGVISANGKRDALRDQITQLIADELPASQQRADAQAARVDAEPTHSWSAQHCSFASNDGGWMVVDHREVCSLESARAWPVDTPDEAFALLGDRLPTDQKPYVHEACHIYTETGDAYGDQLAIMYIEPRDGGSRWCEPTDGKYDQRRPVAGDLPDLDDSQGWLVVIDSKEVVDEVIGCVHWSVLFCDNPFGNELAWGDPVG